MVIHTHAPRPLVEHTPRIDTIAMRTALRASPGVVLVWRAGPVSFGGKLMVEPRGRIAGAIVATFPGGHEAAHFVAEPGRLGGTMVRAECPRCRARVRYLYVRERALACRACHGLAWSSQRESKFTRSFLSRVRIASKLGLEELDSGPEGGTWITPGDKPHGMHWARFGREWASYQAAEQATADAFNESLRSRRRRLYVPGGYTHRTPVAREVPEPITPLDGRTVTSR